MAIPSASHYGAAGPAQMDNTRIRQEGGKYALAKKHYGQGLSVRLAHYANKSNAMRNPESTESKSGVKREERESAPGGHAWVMPGQGIKQG